ncbi:MAG: PQQ-dependent dehydrogenase, methanol/ethanol family [Acidobacteria bacterium]|nr:PQQ-dependent dehydrogenase, methanol/ethanol family [Acidobacteriota bacterium]
MRSVKFPAALLAASLLTVAASAQVRYEDILAAPSENWLTFMGDYASNRHSPLKQITADNVKNLTPKWFFHINEARRLSSYPIVYDGVLYVTNSNEIYALDAVTGRQIWHYRQEGVEMQRQNRGAAILGDRVFFVTSDCHLLALNRVNGAMVWDQSYADPKEGYHCTVAPVVVKDKLIVGVSGGDSGMRGFLEARNAEDGSQAWHLWTVPAAGEPGSEGWGPKTLPWGGAGTWMPGSYDPETNLLIWPTGNPWPDFYGGDRPGDNLYSDSVIGVDLDSGEMKWHFQFTPHDVWDWDGQEPPVLLDLEIQGKKRKVVVQANRNGFYYILDRTTGEFLHASPFVDKLTWAKGIDKNGRPILNEGQIPTPEGVEACPTVRGAANWMSDSYNPDTGLFYVMTLEACDIYTSSAKEPEPKTGFAGTGGERPPGASGQFILRALQPETGKRVWEYPLTGPTSAWAGTLSTAGGVIFFGDDDNHIAAVDAKSGMHLWHFNMGQPVFASPITWAYRGKQYVSITAANGVFTFGLFEPAESTPIVDTGRKP